MFISPKQIIKLLLIAPIMFIIIGTVTNAGTIFSHVTENMDAVYEIIEYVAIASTSILSIYIIVKMVLIIEQGITIDVGVKSPYEQNRQELIERRYPEYSNTVR